jgi:hypothetical protein
MLHHSKPTPTLTRPLAIFATLVILICFFSGNAVSHESVKSRKLCDTTYYSVMDPDLGDYYLVEVIDCDTIEPTDPFPIGGGVGEP